MPGLDWLDESKANEAGDLLRQRGILRMPAKTTHVIPKNGGWAVRKEGSANRRTSLYSTQKEAIQAARDIVRRTSAGQIVIHRLDGSIRTRDIHGLPEVQQPPRKSELGSKAIERADSTVIRERLSGD